MKIYVMTDGERPEFATTDKEKAEAYHLKHNACIEEFDSDEEIPKLFRYCCKLACDYADTRGAVPGVCHIEHMTYWGADSQDESVTECKTKTIRFWNNGDKPGFELEGLLALGETREEALRLAEETMRKIQDNRPPIVPITPRVGGAITVGGLKL